MTGREVERDERALVERARSGDREAFSELVWRHQDAVYTLAVRLVGPDLAADVAQEALIRAWRALPRFRGEAAFSTWLHRITVNTALDALRSAARRPLRVDRGLDAVDPRDHLGRGEQQLDVRAALAQIPDEQRAAVVLVDMLGLGVAETATVLEVAPGTVKSRCFRGRARLAAMLAAYAPSGAGQGNHGSTQDVQPEDGAEPEPPREEP